MTNVDDGIIIGLMTGTSMDGADAVAVRFTAGVPEVLARRYEPYSPDLRESLLSVDAATPLATLAMLDCRVAHALADCAYALLGNPAAAGASAIGSHGQTVWHQPGGEWPTTIQLGDPNIIAERTGLVTVADFRRRDMAAGGQGAPLAPLFHHAFFGSASEHRALVNIGGIANITWLPARADGPMLGFDTGPGNVLMDAWIGRHRGMTFDRNGAWAASGRVNRTLLARLLDTGYFREAPPKSTGRELFNADWLAERLTSSDRGLPAEDIQATLCELTAVTIAKDVRHYCPDAQRLIVCGGGAKNTFLMRRLQHHFDNGTAVQTSNALGLESQWVEAAGFAWLARERLAGRPLHSMPITGARHPVLLGGIYGGA